MDKILQTRASCAGLRFLKNNADSYCHSIIFHKEAVIVGGVAQW